MLFQEGFRNNPALVFFLGLGPIIIVSTTLERGLMYSISYICIFFCSAAFSPLIKLLVPSNLERLANMAVISVFSVLMYFFTGFYNTLARDSIIIWLYLFGVNELLLGHLTHITSENDFPVSFINATGSILSYSVFFIIFSGIRELLSSGCLTFGSGLHELVITLPVPEWLSFRFFSLVPGGFILIGYSIAFFRIIKQKYAGDRR